MSNGYVLSIPIARGHWVTLVSNQPMETEHFAKLDEYLALQKEVFADAPVGTRPEVETAKQAPCVARVTR